MNTIQNTPAVLANDLLVRAIKGEQVERPPVWIMRQAGRILAEYKAVRASVSGFKELVETPELAAEVTIQPVDIIGVDAAIIFSDILVIPDAMGLPYEMKEGKGPFFPNTIQSASDIEKMNITDGSELSYVYKAIELTRKGLDGRVPVIGFAGAPWTIFCYMIEGGGSKTFSNARRWLFKEPVLAHKLMDKITSSTINYLNLQVEAGVSVVQVFDSWAAVLSESLYREFALPYLERIAQEVSAVPRIVFPKGAHFALADLANTSYDAVGLDWTTTPTLARSVLRDKVLQGNLDPCTLYADDDILVSAVQNMVAEFGTQRYIANLGHGVYPDMDWRKAKLFVDTIKSIDTKQ